MAIVRDDVAWSDHLICGQLGKAMEVVVVVKMRGCGQVQRWGGTLNRRLKKESGAIGKSI